MPSSVLSLQVGALVEARRKGKKKYYSGKIAEVNGDNTYGIQFDDGDYDPT